MRVSETTWPTIPPVQNRIPQSSDMRRPYLSAIQLAMKPPMSWPGVLAVLNAICQEAGSTHWPSNSYLEVQVSMVLPMLGLI